jgi:hypothetical protein
MGRNEPGAFGFSALQIAAALAATGPGWWVVAGFLPRRLRRVERPG